MPSAYGLPNQWPTNPWARAAADRLLAESLAEFVAAGRILKPVDACRASGELLKHTLDERLASHLFNEARAAALTIWEQFQKLAATEAAAVNAPEDLPTTTPISGSVPAG